MHLSRVCIEPLIRHYLRDKRGPQPTRCPGASDCKRALVKAGESLIQSLNDDRSLDCLEVQAVRVHGYSPPQDSPITSDHCYTSGGDCYTPGVTTTTLRGRLLRSGRRLLSSSIQPYPRRVQRPLPQCLQPFKGPISSFERPPVKAGIDPPASHQSPAISPTSLQRPTSLQLAHQSPALLSLQRLPVSSVSQSPAFPSLQRLLVSSAYYSLAATILQRLLSSSAHYPPAATILQRLLFSSNYYPPATTNCRVLRLSVFQILSRPFEPLTTTASSFRHIGCLGRPVQKAIDIALVGKTVS